MELELLGMNISSSMAVKLISLLDKEIEEQKNLPECLRDDDYMKMKENVISYKEAKDKYSEEIYAEIERLDIEIAPIIQAERLRGVC